MGVVRGFLRPGWIALTIVVVGFAVGCFLVLAPWQLGKNTSTQKQISQLKHAIGAAPVAVSSLGPQPFKAGNEWRSVTVTGRYLPDKQAVVRLRSINDSPAYEVLTPLATDAGTFLVNRGYVRPVQGAALPTITAPPTGRVTVTGRLRMPEGTAAGRGPRIDNGIVQVYSIDPAVLGDQMALPMLPGYIQLSASSPGALGEIPLPQMDSGPYLSYGLQWLAFGVMAPLGLGYFVYSEIKHRRADRGEEPGSGNSDDSMTAPPDVMSRRERQHQYRDQLMAASTDGASDMRVRSTIGNGVDESEQPADARSKLADRYGK